jgi:hypothetical protein
MAAGVAEESKNIEVLRRPSFGNTRVKPNRLLWKDKVLPINLLLPCVLKKDQKSKASDIYHQISPHGAFIREAF